MLELRHISTTGFLPTSVFHLLADGRRVGLLQIRHRPSHASDLPPECANHIYYQIEPGERRKGYGTQILRLGLPEAAKLGLAEVAITCDASNVASRRIIEANGGIYEYSRRSSATNEPVLKYRIKTGEAS